MGTLDYAGFFGDYALGVQDRFSERHEIGASIGSYLIEAKTGHQLNLVYRYSPWTMPYALGRWVPAQAGLFTIVALDGGRYFFDSPGRYPYSGYYDETAYRFGLELGTTVTFGAGRFEVAYRIRILDDGLIALYNNTHRDLQYYISSGLALHYLF